MDPATASRAGEGRGRVSAAEIRRHLEQVLASAAFGSAPTLGRLLKYLVEHSLGADGPAKEYTIGVELFGRGAAFDPQSDTIVRVHARRLRQRLDDYYAREGRDEPVRLALPKGHYAVEASFATLSLPGPVDGGPSIVVLPFVNTSGPEREYFADGLTDEVTAALAALAGVHVVARTSAFQFKGRCEDIRHVGRALGVRLALEGSVRWDGPAVRVHTQLIDVHDGLHVWSQTYARDQARAFQIQDEIADAIFAALRDRLGLADAALRSVAPAGAAAYDCYLKGRFFWNRGGPEDIAKAIRCLEQAIVHDPGYAAAYAAIADAHMYLATISTEDPTVIVKAGREAAAAALALRDLAEGHSAMGAVLGIGDWDWAGAEREFRRALELMPSFAHARGAYAVCCLAPMRRYEEAIAQLRQALRLDPLSVFLRGMLGQMLLLAGRAEEAAAELRDALELEPGHIVATLSLGWALIATGDHAGAIGVLEQVPAAARALPNVAGHVGHAHARLGHREQAEELLAGLHAQFPGPWVPGVDIAAIHSGLGNSEAAAEWLARARALRSFDVVFVPDDPRFAALRRA